MNSKYYILLGLGIVWLVFYFLVAYTLDNKKSTFNKYAFFTVINGIFIMLCYTLLTTNLELEKQIKKLETKIKTYERTN